MQLFSGSRDTVEQSPRNDHASPLLVGVLKITKYNLMDVLEIIKSFKEPPPSLTSVLYCLYYVLFMLFFLTVVCTKDVLNGFYII